MQWLDFILHEIAFEVFFLFTREVVTRPSFELNDMSELTDMGYVIESNGHLLPN